MDAHKSAAKKLRADLKKQKHAEKANTYHQIGNHMRLAGLPADALRAHRRELAILRDADDTHGNITLLTARILHLFEPSCFDIYSYQIESTHVHIRRYRAGTPICGIVS